jgi:hypothetical protein
MRSGERAVSLALMPTTWSPSLRCASPAVDVHVMQYHTLSVSQICCTNNSCLAHLVR